MKTLYLTILLNLGYNIFSQDTCGIRILITIEDIPKFVLYDNGKIIYKLDDKSPTYVQDSLSNNQKTIFINSLDLDSTYYYSKNTFLVNSGCEDCGKELLFYTNINGSKRTHIIFDYSVEHSDKIPSILHPLFNKAFNYNSTSLTNYSSPKIIVWLFKANKSELKKYKKPSWSFDWQAYEKSNINFLYPNSPMVLVDTQMYNEILQKMKTDLLIFYNRPYRVVLVRPFLEKEECFGQKRYYLKTK
jgi:hypothetical protein